MTMTQQQRDELVTALFENDVKLIRKDLAEGDTTYLWHILSGQGWTQYRKMGDHTLLETVELHGLLIDVDVEGYGAILDKAYEEGMPEAELDPNLSEKDRSFRQQDEESKSITYLKERGYIIANA